MARRIYGHTDLAVRLGVLFEFFYYNRSRLLKAFVTYHLITRGTITDNLGTARKIFEDLCQFAPERYLPLLNRPFNHLYFQGKDEPPPVSKIKYQL